MAYLRLTMRKITEILRLKFGVGLSMRAVAQSLNIGYGTVANYIKRAEEAGLNWPLPPDIDERSLGRLLFPAPAPQRTRASSISTTCRSIRS